MEFVAVAAKEARDCAAGLGRLVSQHLIHQSNCLPLSFSFLENLDRISQPDYRPTHQDVLRSRMATTGINEIEFKYKNSTLKSVQQAIQSAIRLVALCAPLVPGW